ncbi:MAG TPA: response regulator [Planctomycetota bacterium]|jgi:two-component system chemotaxis response regulator CheY
MSLEVLIVDDSATTRMVIERIVRLTEPEVGVCHQAMNGRQAIEILKERWIDCVFTDLYMPEMDGRELLRRMRENELWRHIPVAVITSAHDNETAVELVQLGAHCYRTKPLTPEMVRDIFEALKEKMPWPPANPL